MIRFSDTAQAVMESATHFASLGGGFFCTEHLLCGLLAVPDTAAYRILKRNGITLDAVRECLKLESNNPTVFLSPRAKTALAVARQIAMDFKCDEVQPEHLLYGALDDTGSYCCSIVLYFDKEPEDLQRQAYDAIVESCKLPARSDAEKADDVDSIITEADDPASEFYTFSDVLPKIDGLDGYGTDLTLKAKQGKLDPVIGRDLETQRVIQVLCRRTKNNPVLIGEPGVGKSAIVDGLAIAIAEGKVPESLQGKTVFSLDLSAIVAGTKYRGEFEERINNLLKYMIGRGDVILFIDEIHTLIGTGASEGALDAANILKPLLARGEITTIGATTIEEYRKHIEKDSALERRFQPVRVDEPSASATIEILRGVRGKYEAHHGVAISDDALEAAARLSDRYVRDRYLPDKAVDLIDEAASCKRIAIKDMPREIKDITSKIAEARKTLKQCQGGNRTPQFARLKQLIEELTERLEEECEKHGEDFIVGENDIANIVAEWTGIPVTRMSDVDQQQMANLEEKLKSKVIGQDKACEAVARAVRRARSGIKDPKRPIGSFLFLGPTGVGKTELAKSLAQAMFGNENALIRIDMSEYMDKSSVSRLIGAAPGLVGFGEGGQLTEKVRRKPYSVVLFDEIEKGHEEIYNILLQMLDDGILTDGKGKTVSFKNCVIILTSNIGASKVAVKSSAIGFGSEGKVEERQDAYMSALREYMKPEIINRLDEIIVFNSLAEENMKDILDIMISSLKARLEEKGIKLKLTEAAKAQLIKEGYDRTYGARPMRRALQRFVEDKLSELIVSGELEDGDVALVDANGTSVTVEKI